MMLATSAASRLPFFYREIFYSALLFPHQSRGVFQKAGYVTYPGKFEDKQADNLSFRFQNRRLPSGYVSNHSDLLSEDSLLQSRLCSRISSLQCYQRTREPSVGVTDSAQHYIILHYVI